MVPIRSFDQLVEQLKQRYFAHQRPILWGVGAVTLAVVATVVLLFAGLPGRNELRNLGEMPQATTLYDIHKRPVFRIFKEYRIEVPLSRMSLHLRKAIVAFEDQRFEDHHGFDPRRIFGAALADVRDGRKAQGASTITQQLARQTFLTREKSTGGSSGKSPSRSASKGCTRRMRSWSST